MIEQKQKIESELMYIKGVGPKRAEGLAAEGLLTPADMVLYFPKSYIDRASASTLHNIKRSIINLENDESEKFLGFVFKQEHTLICRIVRSTFRELSGRRKMLKLTISDGSGDFGNIVFWNRAELFERMYPVDSVVVVSGKPELDINSTIQFSHPEMELIEQEEADEYKNGRILPKYRISENMRKSSISMPVIRKILRNVLEKGGFFLEETIDSKYIEMLNLPTIHDAVRALHFPETKQQLEIARFRIKFEELLHYQLSIAIKKQFNQRTEIGFSITEKSRSARTLYENLPFELTASQKRVLKEIDTDFRSGKSMNRLLQGDVGSGKTIVAILSMLMAIDSGLQVAFMAPTEILAEQHFNTLKKFFEGNFGTKFKVVQLIGGQRTKVRREVLEEISSGNANIIVGTHALFQSEIQYNNLGYIIIDEQHRFGVAQRAELISLGKKSFAKEQYSPHILVMTATPIPRTLTMTIYGDLDVSIINEMPKNRKPIKTAVQFDTARNDVYDLIRREIKLGRQAYIVYPLVEKSEKLELKAATEQYEIIRNEIFPQYKCGLLHGQMFWYEKEEAMQAFLKKEYDILVATTVIEVGIDVPNASVMLIENAERFGLSQLHQLRGRVGRGAEQSYCILMTKDQFKYKMKSSQDAESERISAIVRLKTMERTNDGFEIAEVDMKLRGPGDILGTRQAGLPEFRYADLITDKEIIIKAKSLAEEIIADDPNLSKTENSRLRKTMERRYNIEKTYLGIA